MKPKYEEKGKLCYMDTDSLIVYIKSEDIYLDIAYHVEIRFDTSNYDLDRPLSKGKNKKLIGLMKDELGGKIMTQFAALKPNIYLSLTDDNDVNKKLKGTKKFVIKRKLKFEDYKNCLVAIQLGNKTKKLEKKKADEES